MRTNKVNNLDLFTSQANPNYKKHVKTQSKQALEILDKIIDWNKEEEIADRRSFQMFLQIHSEDSIPDETTICRYRELFSRLGLDKKLFETFNEQLRARNMILERITLVDATIKQAQAKPWSSRDTDAQFPRREVKHILVIKDI